MTAIVHCYSIILDSSLDSLELVLLEVSAKKAAEKLIFCLISRKDRTSCQAFTGKIADEILHNS